jgi:hypothetical protein
LANDAVLEALPSGASFFSWGSIRRSLSQRRDLNLARASKDIDPDAVLVTLEGEIDGGIADPEIAHLDARQRLRKRRVPQIDSRLACTDRKARQDCSSREKAPAAQACGEQATG